MRAGLLYLAVLGGIMLAAISLVRLAPRWTGAIVADRQGRGGGALDGMRGILARTVLIHHLLLGYLDGASARADAGMASGLVHQLGSVSVALFFMISAYLFGGKLIRSHGRNDALDLIVGRTLRIVPLYAAVVMATLATALAVHHFAIVVPVARLLLFDFVEQYDVNGFAPRLVLGQAWTLRYEWVFYLTLPAMGWLFRTTGRSAAPYLPLFILALVWQPICFFFIAGLAVAQWDGRDDRRPALIGALLAPAGLLAVLLLFPRCDGPLQAVLLAPLLMAVVRPSGWVRLLQSRACRLLGEVSFGIYLCHSLVGFVFGAVDPTADWHLGSAGFVLRGVVIGVATVAFGIAAHLAIERPFMRIRSSSMSQPSRLLLRRARRPLMFPRPYRLDVAR